jgi:hypothetical protein
MPTLNKWSPYVIFLGILLHVKLSYANSNGHGEEEVSSDVSLAQLYLI